MNVWERIKGFIRKIKENKKYPAQLTFGQWKDVADDDASGYVQINN